MVAVLLASQGVMSGYLQVGSGGGRNPHLRPGRRNYEAIDALQGFGIADFLILRVVVCEITCPRGLAREAGALVGGVAQAGHPGLAGRVFVHDMGFVLRNKRLFAGFRAGRIG